MSLSVRILDTEVVNFVTSNRYRHVYNVLVLFVCVRVCLPVLGVLMCVIDMGSLYFYRMSVMILRY